MSAGRGAAAQPAFEPGPRIPLAKGARGGADVGDLVTVTVRGRAGRVTAVHGPATSPRAALRALLAAEDLARPFPRAVLDEARGARRGRRRRRSGPSRPARPARHHDRPRGRQGPRRRHRGGARGRRRHAGCGCTSPTCRASSPPAGALDREAARRGCSVYVPGHGHADAARRGCRRTCAACAPASTGPRSRSRWSSTPTAAVGETRFSRSLIRSERRLTYGEADARHGRGRASATPGSRPTSRRIAAVAAALRARRMARGALEATSAEPVVRFAGDRVAAIHLEGQTPGPLAGGGVHDRRQRGRRAPPHRARHADGVPPPRGPGAGRIEMLYAQLEALGVATPPLPDGPARRRPSAVPRPPPRRRRSRATWRPAARAATPCGRWCCARCARPTTRPPRSATRGWRARPTCTSPRRSGATPTCWCTAGCSTRSASAPPGPASPSSPSEADHSSATEREAAAIERRADDICAAFLLRDRLTARGLGHAGGGARHGPHRRRPLRHLRRGLHRLPAVAPPGGRPLPRRPARRVPGSAPRPGAASGSATTSSARVVRIEPLRGRIELEPAGARSALGATARAGPRAGRRGRAGARPR